MNKQRRYLGLGLALAWLALPATAEVMLVPQAVAVLAREVVTVRVVVTNGGVEPMTWPVKPVLTARLHSGSAQSEDVVLQTTATAGARVIPPGGYLQLAYRFQLQPGTLGPVVLELTEVRAQPAMFAVQPAGDAARASVAVGPQPEDDPRTVKHEAALRRSTRLFPGISRYEPVYFGLGVNSGLNAKFQISLKYQPLDLFPLYLSYTQTSLWDLHGLSKPFRDTSYRPRVFYLNERLWMAPDKEAWLGLEAGFGHESNGKGGADSRSINIAYVRPRYEFIAGDGYHWFVSPMIYGYVDRVENPDIANYRGYLDLILGVTKNGWRLSTTLRKGTKGRYGSLQADAVLPLRASDFVFKKIGVQGLNGYWFFQYFNGWGETILDYNRKLEPQFRTGIMLVP